MPLNIGMTGNIKPYVKYNAKADKWSVSGEDSTAEVSPPTFAADFDNIATGFLRFRENQAPERLMDPSLDRSAPCPDEGFKRGFVLSVYSPKYFGGLVELSSASFHMGNAIREIYQIFEEQRGDHPGQVPIVTCTGSEAMKDRYGTNYKPTLEIVKWIDRPDELPDESPVDPADIWHGGAAVEQPAKPAPPPPQAPTYQTPATGAQPPADDQGMGEF